MCGICGIFGVGARDLVESMASTLTHRGPDKKEYYINDQVSLGNRRLSMAVTRKFRTKTNRCR